MDPMLLQKQLRDNNTDLHDYLKDIKNWGEEMKRKEAALKNNEENEKPNDIAPQQAKQQKKEKPIKPPTDTDATRSRSKAPKDLSFWNNFDAEAECEKLDKDTDSDLSDEIDEETYQEAQEEKNQGNEYFKKGKWAVAIQHYSQAINLYGYEPTFYANRAMCHLKMSDYAPAEADCTIALQLDKKYVKAFHRRALAREGLKQYKEAKEDLVKVLELEPENKESQKLLDKIEEILKPDKHKPVNQCEIQTQRPVSKFTASRQKQPIASSSTSQYDSKPGPAFSEAIVERKKPAIKVSKETRLNDAAASKEIKCNALASIASNIERFKTNLQWPAGDDVNLVKCFTKSPKDRSRVSLKRITVQESTLKSVKIS